MNLTGYYLLDGRIRGPQRDGEFWIENDRVRSANDPTGSHHLENDGRIRGPNGLTAFRLDRSSGQILGPHSSLPWFDRPEEDEGPSDALGG